MKPINSVSNADLAAFAVNPSMIQYQTFATQSAFYPGRGTPLGLMYCALKLNGEAGELAEHVGKAMRDDALTQPIGFGNGVEFETLTPERRELIIKEVGDVLWYVSALANELGVELSVIAHMNLIKLARRTVSNTLQGSGDER